MAFSSNSSAPLEAYVEKSEPNGQSRHPVFKKIPADVGDDASSS